MGKLFDKWGPMAVALATLLLVIGLDQQSRIRLSWWQGRVQQMDIDFDKRTKSLEREIARRDQIESSLRTEIQTWQAHVVVLRIHMVEAGIKGLPDMPKPTQDQP